MKINSRHTTEEDVYNLGDLITRQWNWKLVDQFMNLHNTFNFETENKWDVASSRQKELVKRLEHIIYFTAEWPEVESGYPLPPKLGSL